MSSEIIFILITRKIIYSILFVFCTWLALATRWYPQYFFDLVVKYGGDVIWSGMFLFFLRIFFAKTSLWKLALCSYVFGVLIEFSQLYRPAWLVAFRRTFIGKTLLGSGFLWSDIVCYAIGTLLAMLLIILIEKITAKAA